MSEGTDFCNPADGTHIAFAQDVRAEWKDPDDVWQCQCDCADPSSPGSSISTLVQGCAPGGLADDENDDIQAACASVCQGAYVCEGAPACRIGVCQPVVGRVPISNKLIFDACEPSPGPQRVTPEGDYLVQLDHDLSYAQVGDMSSDLSSINVQATPHLTGLVWADLSELRDSIEFADVRVKLDEFSLPAGFLDLGSVDVTDPNGFALNRFTAPLASDGTFVVKPGVVQLALQADVNKTGPGGADFLNSGSFDGGFDLIANHFSMDGRGRSDETGKGVVVHLEGTIVHHPPTASPGPDHNVECQSPTTTPVVLDGRTSRAADPGDSIAHYQWFEGDAGLSNQPTLTVEASFGRHDYELHVYDQELGSGMAMQHVKVVDTTPPQLNVEPADVCLWPPNHTFALFGLGSELQFNVFDKCDPNPRVWIESIVGDEPDQSPGSGNTTPDVAFGTAAGCVRAEREGMDGGRTYSVTVKARDFSCNETTQVVRVFVPHDQSGQPSCERTTGLDVPDARCYAGAPVPTCIPRDP